MRVQCYLKKNGEPGDKAIVEGWFASMQLIWLHNDDYNNYDQICCSVSLKSWL